MLQEDNCEPNRVRSIAVYLPNEEVTLMKWPAQSPDQDSIENILCIMTQNLRKRYVHFQSILHLFEVLSEMWNTLPDSLFENLVESNPKSAKMVNKNRDRSTKYQCLDARISASIRGVTYLKETSLNFTTIY